jgi:hypothetical protein
VFDKYASNRNNTYKELQKNDFIELLRDSEILILPKKIEVEKPGAKARKPTKEDAAKKAAEEAARKAEEAKKEEVQLFVEDDAMQAIEPVTSFEPNMMNYYGFLEALVRIANVYPFSKEQLATE